jgi:hypothetical protein
MEQHAAEPDSHRRRCRSDVDRLGIDLFESEEFMESLPEKTDL